jgi:hypothetical protein
VLMGVARIYLIYCFVGKLIVVLWVRGCSVCEVLVCTVRGTASGMLSRVLLVKKKLCLMVYIILFIMSMHNGMETIKIYKV